MIFFVLSGYVLTSPYFTNEKASLVLQRRLWGRYLRLNIPIAATVFFSYLIYLCHGYYNLDIAALSGSTDYTLFFKPDLSYVTALRDFFWGALVEGETNFNPVFWTLKAEFLGSVYLLLFYLVKPPGKNALFLLAAMFLLTVSGGKRSVFIVAIFLGSFLNVVTIPKKWNLLLFLCGVYFAGFQYRSSFYDFLPTPVFWQTNYFYVGIGAILMAAPLLNGYGENLLQSRACQFLGTISFPFYLIHSLLLCSFSSYLALVLPHTLPALFLNLAIFLSVSIALATLFERYIDKPAVAFSHYFSALLFKK